MWSHDNSTVLSLICTRIVAAAVIVCAFFVPGIVGYYTNSQYNGREAIAPTGRMQVTAGIYICLLIALFILYMLDRLLSNIRKEEIFIPQNVSYLRGISWACFAMCVPCLLVSVYGSQIFLFIMVAAAFMGLILRVVKNVIESAVLIKEENDYTV
ncbi:MAG: DUF2975 domain-containing protein [Erysipelotrichaceae bacterium]|jgi:ABC-type sugar transport system permease subunit|nr:DUF2975 domain-containing protein [Erysipelotrichaceae bacterium]